jgi:hypothetical protein
MLQYRICGCLCHESAGVQRQQVRVFYLQNHAVVQLPLEVFEVSVLEPCGTLRRGLARPQRMKIGL